ncbi:MAG: sigma-70 family RNA polymerase sigma factor [Candidatus Omnitrophica bacterium]|nr:sigma-70 family RNA polymerase sigma factor [Candidatus Omnitrophota bacterium]
MRRKLFENERALIDGCVKRDLAAWGVFVRKYSNLVSVAVENRAKKYGFYLIPQDIEDIRQNVFTLIWQDNKLSGVENSDSIAYWIAIVAGNEAMAHLRKRETRESEKAVSIFDKIDEKELAEVLPSDVISPADEAARNEISAKIDDAIKKLGPKERLIIKLHLIHNKKYHEISKMLNIPKGTVSSYVKRAKEELKERLKKLQQF